MVALVRQRSPSVAVAPARRPVRRACRPQRAVSVAVASTSSTAISAAISTPEAGVFSRSDARMCPAVRFLAQPGSKPKPGHRAASDAVILSAKRRPDATDYPTIEDTVGKTPLVRLQRMNAADRRGNVILLKLEGNNPAGSVKDRPALSMITEAEIKGRIKPGDTLIEATSGNTGIALAMASAIKGYKLRLIMPSNMSEERRAAMAAYGATLISVPPGNMEMARDMAQAMAARGEGVVLDQFGNLDNPLAHYKTTGPEIWAQTAGRVTHFVSSMGTTGTIMGTGRYLKERNPAVQIIGLQPAPGASIAGIRRWPKEYLPSIFEPGRVDLTLDIGQQEAEDAMRALAVTEGIFAGVSSGGAVSAALRISATASNATIVAIVCDRGDRYLSTGIYTPRNPRTLRDCTPGTLRAAVDAALPRVRSLAVLFTADADATGLSWCPDCRRAVPAVMAALAETAEGSASLLVCNVGAREVWKDPAHPLRTDAELRIGGVPTLMRWGAGGPGARMAGLETEMDPAAIRRAAAAFFAGA